MGAHACASHAHLCEAAAGKTCKQHLVVQKLGALVRDLQWRETGPRSTPFQRDVRRQVLPSVAHSMQFCRVKAAVPPQTGQDKTPTHSPRLQYTLYCLI